MSIKLSGSKINDAINGNLNFQSLLIYGNDGNLIQYRSDKVKQKYKNNGFKISVIDCKNSQDSKNTIITESQSVDFFANNKLIIVLNIADKIFTQIQECITNATFVFVCYDITRCPKMRDYHEKNAENAASIACYPIEESDVSDQVRQFLKNNNISLEDQNLLPMIAQMIGNNPFDIDTELEKIFLLTTHSKILTYENVMTIGNNNEASLFEFINVFFAKQLTKITEYVIKFTETDVSSVMLSRMMYKYACKLITAQINIQSGSDKASEAKKAGIFFKNTNIFYQHLDSWSIDQLNKLVIKLFDFDKDTRISTNSNILPNVLNLLRL